VCPPAAQKISSRTLTVARNLRLIASLHCSEYQTGAKCFIDDALPSGPRRLYDNGGYAGRRELAACIADDWSEQDVMHLLLSPMKDPSAPYPSWEVPARALGSHKLFRWWSP
jgi:hypothetical protein